MLIQKSIKQPVDKYNKKDEDDDNENRVVKTTTTRTSSRGSTRAFVTASATAAAITTIANPIDDYRIKREKNNESVRKSRAKNRVKVQECAERVKELKDESIQLNTKLSGLQSELSTLRSLFQYCFSFNTNQMPFKPSEVPTSTLYKIIMQNKTKFMQPVTNSNLTETIQQATSSLYALPALMPVPEVQMNEEKSDQALFDDKDSFFINELKQSLIDFIKYDDSASTTSVNNNTTPSTTVSSPSSPFMSSSSNDYLAENDVIIDNDDKFLKFLDDHDYSVKRVKLNI
jgi:hypothetical protein